MGERRPRKQTTRVFDTVITVALFDTALNFVQQEMKQELVRIFLFCFAVHDAPGLGPFPLTVQSQCSVHT